ncbi:MAG: zinc-binding dehydrogenase [Burkholderiales bacterium]|nr:zinc-binding dehydrogenase [Burkholderiales bacterium]
MRAAWYARVGAAADVLRVGVRPRPLAGDGELVVRVAYSAVHPADVKRRAGTLGQMDAAEVIPHSDGSGIVEAVGAGLAEREWLGRRVWMFHAQRGRAEGTAAEYITLPARLCRPVQGDCSLRDASCIGIPMLTSHVAVLGHGAVTGKRVLITGAAGSVGRYALQWARWAGASCVLATVANATQKALALELGANDVLDIHADDPADWIVRQLGSARSIDVLVDIDMGRNGVWVPKVLAPHAIWSTFASSMPVALDFRALLDVNARLRFIRSHSLAPAELNAALDDIDRIHAAGAVKHVVSDVLALEQIASAHELVERGHRQGATVLSVSDR